jgi:hypothetical protein
MLEIVHYLSSISNYKTFPRLDLVISSSVRTGKDLKLSLLDKADHNQWAGEGRVGSIYFLLLSHTKCGRQRCS